MNVLILGIGNPILTDDGVGIIIAQKLKEKNPELVVIETSEAGIALLDFVIGYKKLIIIDSIKIEEGKPGDLYKLELEDLKPSKDLSSSHGIGIATAVELGKRLGYNMPKNTSMYAVNIKDNTTFGENCTRMVKEKIPLITKQIIKEERL
ncbi:hydrogenase maturation protease [Chloroflexota bacterium]